MGQYGIRTERGSSGLGPERDNMGASGKRQYRGPRARQYGLPPGSDNMGPHRRAIWPLYAPNGKSRPEAKLPLLQKGPTGATGANWQLEAIVE